MKTLTLLLFVGVLATSQTINFQQLNSGNIVAFLKANPEATVLATIEGSSSQIGNLNIAKIKTLDDQVDFLQYGDRNQLYYSDSSSLQSSTIKIIENGTNNYVDVIGSNHISDGMTIKINGDNKTVIVKNH